MTEMPNDLFVVDAITAKPGQARAVREFYMSDYAPGAAERGMKLVHSWVSPAIALQGDRSNILTFIWAVAGTPGWWRMRLGAAFDPTVEAFWAALAPLIVERSRQFQAQAEDHV